MLSLSSKDLPQIKDWKVGDEYELIIKVRQKNVHVMEMPNHTKMIDATFEVTDIMVPEEDTMDISETGMNNKEFANYAAKRKAIEY